MADPGSDVKFDKGKEKQVIGGQQSHRSEYGEQSQQTGTRGQPIGGNDSGTGSGTPLSQGAEFARDTATGQAQPGTGSMPPRSMGTHGPSSGR